MAKALLSILTLLLAAPGFYSVPLERERRLADDCITDIYVSAHTALPSGAGTNQVEDYEFIWYGITYTADLHDMPKDQASEGKGDLWKLSLVSDFNVPTWRCIKKSQITYAAIEAAGSDGWRIDSVTSYIKKVSGGYELFTCDLDADQWIDTDGDPQTQPGVTNVFELNRV